MSARKGLLLAYYDTFAGLIPCKVRNTEDDGSVWLVLTATRGAYERGEILHVSKLTASLHLPPRENVRRSGYSQVIFGGWNWSERVFQARTTMSETERTAHDAILRWCRSEPRGQGHPVMRELTERAIAYLKLPAGHTYVVVDVSRTEPLPGSSWERRDRIVASGDTWETVLAALPLAALPLEERA